MEKYFIALEPEKKLFDLIRIQKQLIKNCIGEQEYLSDPPHFTIIVLTSDNKEAIIKELQDMTKNIKKFLITFSDFKVFYEDIQTGGNTITYSLLDKDENYLKTLQLQIINSISKFNTKGLFSEKNESYAKMSEIEKENVKAYGFPFVGKNWIPHITLASIEKDKFDVLWGKIKKTPIAGSFLLESINFYKIGEKPELIKKFELK